MTKLKYIGATDAQVKWGGNTDPRPILIEGYMYDLAYVDVRSSHTKIALKGIQGWFNSVSFESLDKNRNWLEPYFEAWRKKRYG